MQRSTAIASHGVSPRPGACFCAQQAAPPSGSISQIRFHGFFKGRQDPSSHWSCGRRKIRHGAAALYSQCLDDGQWRQQTRPRSRGKNAKPWLPGTASLMQRSNIWARTSSDVLPWTVSRCHCAPSCAIVVVKANETLQVPRVLSVALRPSTPVRPSRSPSATAPLVVS